jgi:hypothetical protein
MLCLAVTEVRNGDIQFSSGYPSANLLLIRNSSTLDLISLTVTYSPTQSWNSAGFSPIL